MYEEQKHISFSGTDSNGCCAPDAHDFQIKDVYTGGWRYQCRKCGMLVLDDTLVGSVEKRFFGSFIKDVSYRWHPDYMDASEITTFTVLYGDSPRVKITFEESSLKVENQSSNKSFGWYNFFNSRQIALNDNDLQNLRVLLNKTEFTQWETPLSIVDRLTSPGFRVERAFFCTFSNGRQYKSLAPQLVGFHRLTRLLEELCGIDRPPFPFPNIKTVEGKQTACCDIGIAKDYSFCPKCGKPAADPLPSTEIPYDVDITSWLCDNCGEGISMEYRYCGKCGRERPW